MKDKMNTYSGDSKVEKVKNNDNIENRLPQN